MTSLVMIFSTLNVLGLEPVAPSNIGQAPRGPITISTLADLLLVQKDLDNNYSLSNDIDASATKNWESGLGFAPIGNTSKPFTGHLNGRGHTIHGLFINRTSEDFVGMFGSIGLTGNVTNLTLDGLNITGKDYVGGLASEGDGTFSNITISGTVSGHGDVEGLFYTAWHATISNVSFQGKVTATGPGASGLIFGVYYCKLSNVSSSAEVKAANTASGLLGTVWYSTITNAFSTGNVTAPTSGAISFIGDVNVGTTITDTFTTSSVSTASTASGYAMINKGTIKNSYSAIKMTFTSTGRGFVISNLAGVCTGDFWDNQTSGVIQSQCGATYKNTSNMKKAATFTGAGWDFQHIWDIIEGKSYPFLRSFSHNFNATPVNGTVNAVEDQDYSVAFKYSFFDYPGLVGATSAAYTMNCQKWCKYDPATHVLSGKPNNGDVGNFWLDIKGTDEGGRVGHENYTFKVLNAKPVFTKNPAGPAPILIKEDSPYSFDINTDDEGLGQTNYKFDMAPAWLTINATTGVMTGTPDDPDVGTWMVVPSVDDGNGGKANITFYLTVTNVNDPPLITSNDVNATSEGAIYHVVYTAKDPDPTKDTLTWGLKTNALWLVLDPATGFLQGMPTHEDVGSYWANISVIDGNGGSDSSNFTLKVTAVDHAPRILTAPLATATEDAAYWVQFIAYDADPEDALGWGAATNATWLGMNSTTGILSGTPALADVGHYWVNVSVTDGHGGSDSRNFTLTVVKLNHAPVIRTESLPTAVVNVAYSLNLLGTDVDGNALTWSLSTTAKWLSIGKGTGSLSGTPAQTGSFLVMVNVSDGAGGTASKTYQLVVVGVNHPPVWSTVPANTTLEKGKDLLALAKATDPDPTDVLVYTLHSDPSSPMTMDHDTGLILWLNVTTGNYTVTINASDGHASIYRTFTLKVLKAGEKPPVKPPPANKVPSIDPIGNQQAKSGTAFSLRITGKDADTWDAKNLTFRLVGAPSGMVISADGQIIWTPTDAQVGSPTVTVTLSDGKNSTSSSFQMTVAKGSTGKTNKEVGYSWPWLLVLLVVGLVIGAIVGLVATRKKGDGTSAPEIEEEEKPSGAVKKEDDEKSEEE